LTDLSINTGINERDLYRSIQFYKKYPYTNDLPEGKNISWSKIVTKYLPKSNKVEKEIDNFAIAISEFLRWANKLDAEHMDKLTSGQRAAVAHVRKEFGNE